MKTYDIDGMTIRKSDFGGANPHFNIDKLLDRLSEETTKQTQKDEEDYVTDTATEAAINARKEYREKHFISDPKITRAYKELEVGVREQSDDWIRRYGDKEREKW